MPWLPQPPSLRAFGIKLPELALICPAIAAANTEVLAEAAAFPFWELRRLVLDDVPLLRAEDLSDDRSLIAQSFCPSLLCFKSKIGFGSGVNEFQAEEMRVVEESKDGSYGRNLQRPREVIYSEIEDHDDDASRISPFLDRVCIWAFRLQAS
ncbi:hypothetical protein K431DRAFT_314133 [Polychaeton citri CBS 116435]|uniref:Uncharacterized protein n=1 Tax=Polychaeton citri CBS 116435 TaxID=1314669 RepID=A0A9P4Q4N4_9PEZI|nr:hypothetical protein K431DRAFT_314133 [Polychaeton citri CBS 116435]